MQLTFTKNNVFIIKFGFTPMIFYREGFPSLIVQLVITQSHVQGRTHKLF